MFNFLGEYYKENGSATGAQERMIELQNMTNERYHRCIQQAVQSGVKVALGSDFVGWDPKITGNSFISLKKKTFNN